MKQIHAFCSAFLVMLIAAPILWLAEWAERCYWRKWGKLHITPPGLTDGHHVYVAGRCRTR